MDEKENNEKEENKNEMRKSGWKEVYRGGGSHLDRVRKEYEELGFEAKLVPILPSECDECTICYKDGNEQLYKVYVRRR